MWVSAIENKDNRDERKKKMGPSRRERSIKEQVCCVLEKMAVSSAPAASSKPDLN